MTGYDYLVVGGGMTEDAAVRAIREIDTSATVGVLSADEFPPYDRPPLSKGLWTGQSRLEDGFHHIDYAGIGVDLYLTTKVAQVLPSEHLVVGADGARWPYRRLLMATGCAPRTLPEGVASPGTVRTYRTLSDYLAVRKAIEAGARRLVIIGGGFIGAELAASVSGMPDTKVTLIFPEPSLWSSRLPPDLSRFLAGYFSQHGVENAPGEAIAHITRDDRESLVVQTVSGRTWQADLVVVAIGVDPCTSVAGAAGLTVQNGIVVDETCHTSAPDILAAGDVACFPSTLGTRERVEHEDQARSHGRIAGINMTGPKEPYQHIPMFYSDLFDLGFEAVGRLDSRLTQISDWVEPYLKGVVYYLDAEERVAGVLLWNVWDRADAARSMLREGHVWADPATLRGRIRS